MRRHLAVSLLLGLLVLTAGMLACNGSDGVMTAGLSSSSGVSGIDNGDTVQVGAFSDTDRALGLHRELTQLYPETTIYADGTWNRVQIGRFQDRNSADDLRRELAVMGLPAVVVAAH